MTKAPECRTCRWWIDVHVADPGERGTCHRFPPSTLAAGAAGLFSPWPKTGGGDFCGEHAIGNPEKKREGTAATEGLG